MTRNELYHHGILGMHWGIRRFQPYPKGQSGKGKFVGKTSKSERKEARRIRKARRLETKAIRKISRNERKINEGQKIANKQFDKAFRKSNSFFSSQKSVDKTMSKATYAQKKVNKLEYKGEKYYKRVEKKMNKLKMDMNPELQKVGERYINSVAQNSKSIYMATMVSDFSGPKHYRR